MEEADVSEKLDCIVGGTPAPALLALSKEEDAAIVAVRFEDATSDNSLVCTGVVVGESAVLTAAHCVDSLPSGELDVIVGPSVACPEVTLSAQIATVHDERDAAILAVPDLPTAADVMPIRWNEAPLEDTWMYRPVQMAGYGSDIWNPPNAKAYVVESIREISEGNIVVDGEMRSGACTGDSGGPLLTRGANGLPMVLGLLSMGSESCVNTDIFLRTDVIADWLRKEIPPFEPSPLCGGIPSIGACYGNIAVRCKKNALIAESCDSGRFCGWSVQGRYACLDSPETPCGEVDQLGICDNDAAYVCEQGKLLFQDCNASETTCRRSKESGVVECEGRSSFE